MSTITLVFAAGEKKQVPGGTLFLLMSTTAAVNVQFFRSNTSLGGGISGVKGGFRVGPFAAGNGFDWAEVESPTAQTVTVFITDIAEAEYNIISGSVSSTETVAASIVTSPDVSIAAVTTGLVTAQNLSRREVLVSSLTTNTAVLRVGDSLVGAARGVPLNPGDSLVLSTTAAIYAYNSHATVAQVLTLSQVVT